KRSINTEIALEDEKQQGIERPKRQARPQVEARVSEDGMLEAAPAGTVAQEPAAAEEAADDVGGEPAEVSAAETPPGEPEPAASGDDAAADEADDDAGDDEKVAAAGD
ncbi:MAG TPA: hypothetical protein VKU40_11380, partial [Thermoanaerobaculia bacterium]|nr:hypothetical protein [Thermoanaerobaculia bacterium]